ncbi:MAG: nucleoside 2-deoxyribosyltransferase [Nanoarchaeota archaeon]
MKVYVAGKLRSDEEKYFLEKISQLCEEIGFKTFLPHRDVGLAENFNDVQRIFNGDIKKGFKDVVLIIADLNGLHVGAGTAWELGYAYAKNIPAIGIKTDESVKDGIEYLSAILIGSMKILDNFDDLKKELIKFKFNLKSL